MLAISILRKFQLSYASRPADRELRPYQSAFLWHTNRRSTAACWPATDNRRAFQGMVTYSVLAMLFLIYVGVRNEGVGLLLWPAVVVHAILIVLLGGAWLKQRKSPIR
jgi:hypothetical protein